MKIAEVIPLADHVLFISGEEGIAGLFDAKPYLIGEAFAPLRDYAEFTAIHNGGYFIEWACGADLSVDTIEAQLEPAPAELVQKLLRVRSGAADAFAREGASGGEQANTGACP